MIGSRQPDWFIILLFLLGFVYLSLGMFQPLFPYDEGLVVLGAELTVHGKMPYRDFVTFYGPAQFYALAGIFDIFGFSILAERCWDTLARFGICLLVWVISRSLGLKKAAWFPFLVVLLALAVCGFYSYPTIPAIFFSFLSLLLLMRFRDHGSLPLIFAGGTAAGVAGLYRQDVAFYTLVAGIVALLAHSFAERSLPGTARSFVSSLVEPIFSYAIGTCTVIVPVAIYFISKVPASDLIAAFWEYPRIHTAFRAIPFPPLIPSLSYWLSSALLEGAWFLFFPPLGVFAFSWGRLVLSAKASAIERNRFARILLTVLGSLFMVPASLRPDTIHCLPSVFVASILFTESAIEALAGPSVVWKRALIGISLPVLSVPFIAAPILRWGMQLSACSPWSGGSTLQRAHFFHVPADQESAVRFVQQNVPPDQTIFVGNIQHQRVLINDVMFYFLACRQPATRHYEFVPGLITTAEVQLEVIRELEQKDVQWAVFASGFDRWPDQTEVPAASGVSLLDDYLGKEFRKVQTFGRYSVWLRDQD